MIDTKSQRDAYGMTLVKLAADHPEIVALDADLSKSTKSRMMHDAYPDRFFEMGIAEANMAGVAAGLSLVGKTPFFSTFAVFDTSRCFDQIRTAICIPALNVKICGSSSGMSDFGDGATHQSVEDIAIMHALPNMNVFVPCDAVETAQIVKYMAVNKGPMYIRVNRNDLPILTEETREFVPGKYYKLRDGEDVLIIACGVMVAKALDAAKQLASQGIHAEVINLPSIKPIDRESLAEECSKYSDIVVAEEHSVIGGLASAVYEAIGDLVPVRIHRIGINDEFGVSAGNYEELLEAFGLTSKHIIEKVQQIAG